MRHRLHDGGHRVLACAKCQAVLSDYHGNYKAGLAVSETSVEVIPRGGNPRDFLDEDMVLRRYCCPGCQTLMTCEVARRSEPMLAEIRFLRSTSANTSGPTTKAGGQ